MTDARRFGEELRRQREERNVSLAEISRQTKVSETLYAALERGDCSRWPAGIYSRSYVRDYAIAVGLQPDRIVAAFVTCFVESATPQRESPVGVTDASRHARPDEPLRLSLAAPPGEIWRSIARIALIAVSEVLLIGAAGAAFALALEFDVWRTVAIAALTYHALGKLLPVFRCVAGTSGLSSLRWAPFEHVRSSAQPQPPSSGTALWWPKRPQRS